jgi:hypothetical protein
MGMLFRFSRLSIFLVTSAGLFVLGCAPTQTVSISRILRQQALLDLSGLKPEKTVEAAKAKIAAPETWDQLVPKKTALYTDMQWRSPSHMSAVGVLFIRMPLPFSSSTLAWFAKREYTKKKDQGKLIGEWKDDLGRPWFEAENNKYHVRGYIYTHGLDAWIVYSGYKMEAPPNASEMTVAMRSMQTIVPMIEPN